MAKENESKKSDGFSIVEMLIAVAIGLIVLAGLVVVFVSQKKAYDVQAQVTEMNQNARAALDMISGDVAVAGYDPTDAGFVGIPYHADQLQLRADLDGDGNTDGPNEDVTYVLTGTVINRISITGGTPVAFAENVEAFTFQYLDSGGNTTTDPDEIQKVRIELTTRTSRPDPSFAENGGYRTRTLSSDVIPRNLAETIVAFLNTGTGVTTTITEVTSSTTVDTGDTGDDTGGDTGDDTGGDTEDTVASSTTTTLPPEQIFNTPTITIAADNESATVCATVIAPPDYDIDVIRLHYMVNNSQNWINIDTDFDGTDQEYCSLITGLQENDIVTFVVQALVFNVETDAYVVVGVSETKYTKFIVKVK